MKQLGKRAAALVAMTAVVLGTTIGVTSATNVRYVPLSSDKPVVMKINGAEIKADEYASYMVYNMRYMENQYAQFGMTGLWDSDETASIVAASLPDATKEQALYTHVVLDNFKKAGLSLNGNQQQELKTARSSMIEQTGSVELFNDFIGTFGFNDQLYDNFMYVNLCYSALNDYYYGVNGIEAPSDAEINDYLKQNYIQAKHILIGTADPMTGEQSRTDEQAKAEAQKALDRINAGEDFDVVMNELSEDTGLQTNPDGYIFTEGDMVTEFYEGAKALSENQVSGLVQSQFGYHIIKREPLNLEGQMDMYRATVLQKMGKTMDAKVTEWMGQAQVETTELYDQINYKNVYDYAPVAKAASQQQ